ncbi:MAG: hypothetical protein AAF456_15400, partial [Planctomycetota bacterium]
AYSTAVRSIFLPVKTRNIRDLRMTTAMDADGHFSQLKQVDVLEQGSEFGIQDIVSSRFQYFDDLEGVWRLLGSLNGEAANEFQFILQWPELEDEARRELYSEHACHELNFFLMKKDPGFFREVVVPHITNKRDKTFMDHYLLGNDVSDFVEPWSYARLNAVERILLAQRIEEQTQNIARNIDDLYRLSPTPRDTTNRYFDVSLAFSSMDLGEESYDDVRRSLLDVADEAMPELAQRQLMRMEQSRSAGMAGESSPAPARGGRGGNMNRGQNFAGGEVMSVQPNVPGTANGIVLGGQLYSESDSINFRPNRGRRGSGAGGQVEGMDIGGGGGGGLGGGGGGARYDQPAMGYDMEALFELREQNEALYRPVAITREWIESNYWKLLPEQTVADRITPNRFWLDFANHKDGPFVSPHFAEANRNLTEVIFAMAVLDLPFDGEEHEFQYADASMTLNPAGPMVVLHQQVRPTVFNPENTTILVSENFFQKNDRYKYEDGLKFDKFVSGDFYAHTLYGGQVVITNPTSTPRPIDLLIQVPQGAVVAGGSRETESMPLDLAAFSTQTFEYYFYFPTDGDFTHFPAHVSSDEQVLAVAGPVDFKVVDRPVEVDRNSWQYVSQNGTDEDVIRYINTSNVQRLDLDKIAFRMKDEEFFRKTVDALRSRFVYSESLWGYSLQHNDLDSIREFLRNSDRITSQLGRAFQSTLITINPVERDWYYHREYSPLINARAHRVGQRNTILNPQFHQQYHQLMEILSNQPALSDDDHLAVTYYMLLQDRIEEAIAHFGQVDQTEQQLQYDYCDAYLDFYLENPSSAVATAQKWEDYPVTLWQTRFRDIIAQAAEIESGVAEIANDESATQRQSGLASRAGSFEFEISEGQIKLDYRNLTKATLNIYEMDIELLFSRSPFAQDQVDGFSMIRPNMTQELELPEAGEDGAGGSIEFSIPEEFTNKNVLVEIVSGDQSQSSSYFENSLNVQMVERFGQLRLTDDSSGSAVAKAYIKVYAKDANGNVRFHKDGYTDLRGLFDYVTQSNNSIDNVVSYSILIMDPERGAVVRQAAPPSR